MSQDFRRDGGLVDRSRTFRFTFNGEAMTGHPGDTLASALLANGRHFVARSFKYHRPRGVFSAGSEEPSALLTVGEGAAATPNTRATTVELTDGLSARSQNHRGSLERDLLAINDLLAPFLAAGFYYKTFMWPASFWEKLYEPAIRKAAGLGALSGEPDPDRYDKGFLHADLLVIGAGPAGLMAALTAARAGKRVILADEDFRPGGRLNAESHAIDEAPGHEWAAKAVAELRSMPQVRVMPRTTVFGAFDHGIYGALERVNGEVRQILWRIYARRAVLAAGATERGIAFPKNDRPGVMLAGAVRTYLNRFGVASGKNVSVFTNNDDGWRTAQDLARQGVAVTAVIDTRSESAMRAPAGVEAIRGGRVLSTIGRHRLHTVVLDGGRTLPSDCLAVAGGWNPNVHLTCHQRGRPVWHETLAAFVPGGELPPGMVVAGAAKGALSLAAALASGRDAARTALQLDHTPDLPRAEDEPSAITPFWHVTGGSGRAWVDLQNDVTVKDIELAAKEGFKSVEHLKRYTTLGMATDQGKTANVLGLALQAEFTGRSIPETGTTIFRPPYAPVTIAAFAGRARGRHFRPTRLTPTHEWAEAQGAVFVGTGGWLRAQWFPQPGEDHWRRSVDREVLAVRGGVGICDVSTLGKIDIQGADATEFVNRVYANAFAKLAVGKTRYGLMLREDGIVMDDGTTARLGEQHYLMTTTTANAVAVFRHLEFCRQCLWPKLDVHLISATEQWAQISIAGPKSRELVARLVDPPFDVSNEAFPFMACAALTVCESTPARLYRISFSGELAYELAVPARYGDALTRRLMDAGADLGVTPYGTEALGVMRIEKGHPAGNELDGRTTAKDLGMARMVSGKKDFIGAVLHRRSGLTDDARPRLMGFKPVDPNETIHAGAHFVAKGAAFETANDQGWMSSAAYSPTLGHAIGLGFIGNGAERLGETVRAVDALRKHEVEVEITSPHFVDPEGERLRA
jgi:sarcosine oxidase subunit alpha